jgi:hypothetical protein
MGLLMQRALRLQSVVRVLATSAGRRQASEELQYIRRMQLTESLCCARSFVQRGKRTRGIGLVKRSGCTTSWNVTAPLILAMAFVDRPDENNEKKTCLEKLRRKQCVSTPRDELQK